VIDSSSLLAACLHTLQNVSALKVWKFQHEDALVFKHKCAGSTEASTVHPALHSFYPARLFSLKKVDTDVHCVMWRMRLVLCSICLFIQSQDFQKHTEHMLNVLYGGSRFAAEALVNATSQISEQVTLRLRPLCLLFVSFLDEQ